jgi:hypothetical protein
MKALSGFLIISVLLAGFVFFSCNKDCSSIDDEFCSYVSSQNYEATGPLVDNYLASLRAGSDENLVKLSEWLAAKSCVDSATIVCNSCIETYPPQSEIRVVFLSGGQKIRLTMDIWMSDPMKFRSYHEN